MTSETTAPDTQDAAAARVTPDGISPKTSRTSYHHGDLRAALVREALRLLEAGETFSLRAVARAAGVSQTAPYRHFPDREHLEAAVAIEGFHALEADLRAVVDAADRPVALADLAVVYVQFAMRRPALFAVMFEATHEADDARNAALVSVHRLLQEVAAAAHPASDPVTLSMAGWSLAHGLAVLHRDGNLTSPVAVCTSPIQGSPLEDQVHAAFAALLTAD